MCIKISVFDRFCKLLIKKPAITTGCGKEIFLFFGVGRIITAEAKFAKVKFFGDVLGFHFFVEFFSVEFNVYPVYVKIGFVSDCTINIKVCIERCVAFYTSATSVTYITFSVFIDDYFSRMDVTKEHDVSVLVSE